MEIKSTKNSGVDKLKILVYGESGVGKTLLAKTLPPETLIISAEAGLLGLSGSKFDVVDVAVDDAGKIIPESSRTARLAQIYHHLQKPENVKKYQWIFIDSLTEISENLMANLQEQLPEKKDTLNRYGENSRRLKAIVKKFRDLPYYNVVFTALAAKEGDDLGPKYYAPSVIGKVSQALPSYFDEVFFMEVEETPEGPSRVLHCDKDERFVAKDRSGLLGKKCPPDLGKIAQIIKGEN